MESFVNIIGTLTGIVGLFAIGFIAAELKHKSSDFLIAVAMLMGITGVFGVVNSLNYEIDYILYPLRLAIMVWCVYLAYKL